MTCAVEWRRVSRSSLIAAPEGAADYTERVRRERAGLNCPESLEAGRDVLPAEGSVVERGLDVTMDLEDEGELMRQRNDGRSTGLASKAFLPVRVHGAAPDAAVLGCCLLDRCLTPWTSADLKWSGLLQIVSDIH
jgi:hypothetical protein